jgi:hypothetical protein
MIYLCPTDQVRGLKAHERGVAYLVNGIAITCGRCGMTSHNPHDVENRYCANCHVFLEDPDVENRP